MEFDAPDGRGRRGDGLPRGAAAVPAHAARSGRTPPHPGRFLETRFIKPLSLSQTELAAALGVSRRRVNELVNGRRGVTPATAVRLAKYFRTDVAFWLQLQLAWDMRNAARALRSAGARPPKAGIRR
jgi:addiction module HigA family antidote